MTAALASSACLTPARILARADATTDDEIHEACAYLSRLAADPGRDVGLRCTAAQALGKLARPDAAAIERLRGVLTSAGEDGDLRAWAAWALGEMRSPESLDALVAGLRTPLGPAAADYLLDGIAKHDASIASATPETLVEIAAALVHFAAERHDDVPPIYDALGVRVKTLPVLITVLHRARTPAEIYVAAFELLEKLELSLQEIQAGPATWSSAVGAAVAELGEAMKRGDARVSLLVTWYLGRLGTVGEIGTPAGELLGGRKLSGDGRQRFVAAWALARTKLHAKSPRSVLAREVFARETAELILDLLAEELPLVAGDSR